MVPLNFFLLFATLLLLQFGCGEAVMDEKQALRVLSEFYEDNVPEPVMDRRLLSAGKGIVPYVIKEIQRKDMPKRRYAISALGKIGDRLALPALVKILEDKSEADLFRGDALTAIWRLDRNLGEQLAKKYSGESPYIDRVIQLLAEGKI